MKRSVALLACLFFAFACSEGERPSARIDSVEPAQAAERTATEIRIRGEGLHPRVTTDFKATGKSAIDATFTVALLDAAGERALPGVRYEERDGEKTVVATVPADLPQGLYSMRVGLPDGRTAEKKDAFRVVTSAENVRRFSFADVPPQRAGGPFLVVVTAVDEEGKVVTGFTGEVTLDDSSGTRTPTREGPFVLGELRRQVVVREPIAAISLTVRDDGGREGRSNEFAVEPGLATALALSSALDAGVAGDCLGPLSFALVDSHGVTARLDAPLSVAALSDADPPVRFFADPSCGQPLTAKTLAAGESGGALYLSASRSGAHRLTLSPDGLPSTTAALVLGPRPPSRLRFTSAPRTVRKDVCSPAVRLAIEDPLGNESALSSAVSVQLTSSLAGVNLYADELCQTALSQPWPLAPGTRSLSLHFKAAAEGELSLSAADVASGLQSDAQAHGVIP